MAFLGDLLSDLKSTVTEEADPTEAMQESQQLPTDEPLLTRKNLESLLIFFLLVLCAGLTSVLGPVHCTLRLVLSILSLLTTPK